MILKSLRFGKDPNVIWSDSLYSWPSTSADSTKLSSKISPPKNSRKFQKAKLEFLHSGKHLYRIYIILGIISNLEMISII